MMAAPSTGGSLPASPRVLGIVGLGLIGASVALAARRRWPGLRIVGVDRPPVLVHPVVVATVDVAAAALDAVSLNSLAEAEILVLATPVDVIETLLPALPAAAPHARLVLDCGSTKRGIVAAARRAGLRTFVGGHPMAGAAAGGPDRARADLFDGRPWLLADEAEAASLEAARAFVAALGARPAVVPADAHDAAMAAVSHLPQVVASVLMTVAAEAAGDRGLAWAGGGLRDTTRLAASPPGMWTSVLAANADCLAPLLRTTAARLETIAAQLTDAGAIEQLFQAAQAARARLDRDPS